MESKAFFLRWQQLFTIKNMWWIHSNDFFPISPHKPWAKLVHCSYVGTKGKLQKHTIYFRAFLQKVGFPSIFFWGRNFLCFKKTRGEGSGSYVLRKPWHIFKRMGWIITRFLNHSEGSLCVVQIKSSWWLNQPIWKIWVKLDHFPR